MAYTSGFFDAVDQGGGNYDRVYSAANFAHYFSLLVQNGVFPDPSTGMQVKASSSPDMHVSVQSGSGWVNGYYITVEEESPEVLTVPTANPSLSRIDSVIMGLNYVDREIQLYIKSGAVSSSPSPTSLQRNSDLYELELAQITVGAGVASISQSNIKDMRQDTSRCGIVKGTIEQIDTTDLFAQYDAAFKEWFEDVQSQLEGDVATNLLNKINQVNTNLTAELDKKVNTADKASTSEAQAATNDTHWMTPSKTLDLIKGQKCSSDDIKEWILKSAGPDNGVSKTFTGSFSGTIGMSSAYVSSSTGTITVPLSTLKDDELFSYIKSMELEGSNSSYGSYEGTIVITAYIGILTIEILRESGVTNPNTMAASSIMNFLNSKNVLNDLGLKLTKTDSFKFVINITRTDSSEYYASTKINSVSIKAMVI